jgi:two-component system, OmpR family, sensor histidine kinase BaeS
MRSIAFKLTLAFLVVGLSGAILMAVILQGSTRNAFNQFILDQNQQALVESFVSYYQITGSWQGVRDAYQAVDNPPRRGMRGRMNNGSAAEGFTLVSQDRIILISDTQAEVGRPASAQLLSGAIPLTVNSDTIGWLILDQMPSRMGPNTPEAIFLGSINRATLLSGLVAVALALALGGLLAFTLTRSLRELTQATEEIAGGRFGRQVQVRTNDEMGELALSFNKMSMDLAQATDLRRQMTADIAHDLRNPLSVLAGYAEALSDGKLAGSSEVYNVLHLETQHLSRLVEDLRTLSLADSGELPLNKQLVAPNEFLERVARRHSMTAQQKGIALRVDTRPEVTLVPVDPERLAQVFDNLVSNAFRYTPQGGEVVLSARKEGGAVHFQVHDSGKGISGEDLPKIFDRFYRGDKARQQTGESGLGLAIARSIVEAHGGKILVESEPDKGSTFTIILPV